MLDCVYMMPKQTVNSVKNIIHVAGLATQLLGGLNLSLFNSLRGSMGWKEKLQVDCHKTWLPDPVEPLTLLPLGLSFSLCKLIRFGLS